MRIGKRPEQSPDAVVARQSIGIAEIEGVSAGGLQPPVEVAPNRASGHEADVFESIERGGGETVALEETDRLAFHLGELSHLEKDRCALGPLQELRLDPQTKPQLVGIDLPVLAGRIAPVLVLRMHLSMGQKPVAVSGIEPKLSDA